VAGRFFPFSFTNAGGSWCDFPFLNPPQHQAQRFLYLAPLFEGLRKVFSPFLLFCLETLACFLGFSLSER
jgi:hypothetical protein